MDRISSLPDSLLCHILSFLPTIDSVATSILSRRWRHLWKDLQVLDLVDEPFRERQKRELSREEAEEFLPICFAEECLTICLAEQYFVAFVNEVVAQVRHIQKFRLSCDLLDRDALTSWINSVTGPHLQELYLSVNNDYDDHNLPCGVFTCASLVSLVLKGDISLGADVIHPLDLLSVHLPSLKNLELCIEDADLIDELLSGCPVLETLEVILRCIDNHTIRMPHSLKSLTFEFDSYCRPGNVIEHLEIDTPSLEFLDLILQDCYVRVLVSNFPNVVEARLDICPEDVHVGWVPELLKALRRTKLLVLEVSTTECLLHAPALYFPEFCCLLHLQLDFQCFNSGFLIDLLHSCHKLRVLIIHTSKHVPYCYLHWKSPEPGGWTQPISVPNCVMSHLNILEFRGYQDFAEEHAFTAYILQRGLVLKTMTIHANVRFGQKKKAHILKELSIIPRGSSMCQLKLD